jgi:quinol monooxygenase YgiN
VLPAVILLTEGVVVDRCCCSYYAAQQREILGTLTVEELYKDRAAFSERVREHVFADISAIGFVLVSYCLLVLLISS